MLWSKGKTTDTMESAMELDQKAFNATLPNIFIISHG